MLCIPLEPEYLTLRGDSSVTSLVQPEPKWLDLAGFQDVVAFLEVKESSPVGATIQMNYQTSPARADDLFVRMTGAVDMTVLGLTVTQMLKDSITNPLARFFRWNISFSGAGTWDITFRLWLAVAITHPKQMAAGRKAAQP